MLSFYFARHGESESNRDGLCCGQGRDVALTEQGRAQAHTLGQKIVADAIFPDIIIHSGLKRSFETAQIVNSYLSLPIAEEPAFKEHDVGDWELKPWAEVSSRWLAREDPPHGETWSDFRKRVRTGYDSARLYGKNPLIIAHGGTLIASLLEFDINLDIVIHNCTLFKIEKVNDFQWVIR